MRRGMLAVAKFHEVCKRLDNLILRRKIRLHFRPAETTSAILCKQALDTRTTTELPTPRLCVPFQEVTVASQFQHGGATSLAMFWG